MAVLVQSLWQASVSLVLVLALVLVSGAVVEGVVLALGAVVTHVPGVQGRGVHALNNAASGSQGVVQALLRVAPRPLRQQGVQRAWQRQVLPPSSR